MVRGALEPAKLARLTRIIDDDLGLVLHRAVEGTKVKLSNSDAEQLVLDDIELDLPVARASFESWIADDLIAIEQVLDRVLADAQVAPQAIDRVFATGGSSLVPAVRARLAGRFGADKLIGGQELTSVAWGLAVRAQQVFG